MEIKTKRSDMMNGDDLEKLSDEIESNCNDNPYVWFYDDERLCLDGDFTLEELRMIVSKWSEAIEREMLEAKLHEQWVELNATMKRITEIK